jgi:hypothetical protein
MTNLPLLNTAETQCLSDFLSIAMEHNLPFFSEYDISKYSNEFKTPPIFLKKFLNQLIKKGIIYKTEDSGQSEYHLSEEYIDDIYSFSEERKILRTQAQPIDFDNLFEDDFVPGSDRFVLRSDNEDAAQSVIKSLTDLSERITISNEFCAEPEERIALSKEITALSVLIGQSKIRVASIKNAIVGSGILRWLATQATDATIKALANQAISYISKLCGYG